MGRIIKNLRAVAPGACQPSTSLRVSVDATMSSEKNQTTNCTYNMIPILIVEIKKERKEGRERWW